MREVFKRTVLMSRELRIGGPPWPDLDFEFMVTNLTVNGEIGQTGPMQIGSLGDTLSLDEGIVRVERLPDYDKRLALLRSDQRDVVVTATMRVPCALSIERAEALATDLCELYSLARGTRCSWVECRQTQDGAAVFARSHSMITRPFAGGMPLIEDDATPEFIRLCLHRYRQLRLGRDFLAVVQILVEIRGRSFLDTRSLLCAALIDRLVGEEAALHNEDVLLAPAQFKPGQKLLRRRVLEAVSEIYPESSEAVRNEMANRTGGMNFTSFGYRLSTAAGRLGMALSSEDVKELLQTRNNLAHRLTFSSDQKFREYRNLLSVADRLVLSLLGYRGAYWDVKDRAFMQVTNERSAVSIEEIDQEPGPGGSDANARSEPGGELT